MAVGKGVVCGCSRAVPGDVLRNRQGPRRGTAVRAKVWGMAGALRLPGILQECVAAAISKGIPVTGTGGTSLSVAATLGAKLCGAAGGSVATTNYTKAVTYVSALAMALGFPYNPKVSSCTTSLTSILDCCLPAFLAVCLCNFMLVLLLPLLRSLGLNRLCAFMCCMSNETRGQPAPNTARPQRKDCSGCSVQLGESMCPTLWRACMGAENGTRLSQPKPSKMIDFPAVHTAKQKGGGGGLCTFFDQPTTCPVPCQRVNA